jgi:hypothetical protein
MAADGDISWTGAKSRRRWKASDAETERQDEVERSRLTMMRCYAEHRRRRSTTLPTSVRFIGPCGNCDNDLAPGRALRSRSPWARGW